MKKITFTLMFMFSVLFLSYCGSDDTKPEQDNSQSAEQRQMMLQRENSKKELEGKIELTNDKSKKFYKLYKKYKGVDQEKALNYYKLYKNYRKENEEAKAEYSKL